MPTASPAPRPSAATPSPTPDCAERTFQQMTPAQRAGQLILLGLANDRLGPQEMQVIAQDHVGSVWFVERSDAGVSAIKSVSDAVQAQATVEATAGVRFLVAANQEGGITQALHGPGFSEIPSASVQGTLPAAGLEQEATVWGTQLGAAGVNLDFAPVMDTVPPGGDAQNQPIGVLHRAYGHDPATVGEHGTAFLRGLKSASVLTTIKHFPGLGRVQGNTDFAASVVDTATTPTDPYLQPFAQGIAAGADLAMVALATYTRIDPDHLAAFSPRVIQMLRTDEGFSGVIVSDDLGATAAVAGIPPGARATMFLDAGGDLIISKTVQASAAMLTAIRAQAGSDASFEVRVDDAVRRILALKERAGLLPCSPAQG
jgi:beta-N-acetylhexosaminidase